MALIHGQLKKTLRLVKHQQKYFKSIQFYTNQALDRHETVPNFRTSVDNPGLHTKDHVGRYYTIPPEVKNALFFNGGIPKRLNIQMKTFCESCIMVREPALEIISFLQNMNFSHPALRFILYGKMGTGKTISLMHILHYAYLSKFLLVHLPWASNWTKRPKEVVDSQFEEGRIDLPVESALWLQHFKQQNSMLMEELKLTASKTYKWSKREITEEGSPLMDIVEHGITRVRHSSDCVAVLMKEIKQQSQTGRFKTLVMVDGVNAFYAKTNVKRPDKSLVPADEITIAHAFLKLLNNDWNNAAVVTSVDIIPYSRDYTMQDPVTPHFLLGKEGFELLDPFIPIETVNYTDKELESMVDYYYDRMWITSERTRGEEGKKQLKFLSGYNPWMVMRLCDPL